MKLTVLIDNNTLIDRYFLAEPGVCYFIEDRDTRVLFDTGYSDAFITNAHKMGIDLLNMDFLVISHGHMDHTWGLDPFIRLHTEAVIEGISGKRPTLIAHPDTFLTRGIGSLKEIGAMFSEEKISRHFAMRLSKDPIWLTERLVFLGEIDRGNDFEAKEPIGEIMREGLGEDDYIPDDSALVYKSQEGLVIIVSCAHAGICNTVEYAKEVCGEGRVADIIGGLHLLNPHQKVLQATLSYLEALRPKRIHPCHCTDLNAKIALSAVAPVGEVGVGLQLEYD